MLFFQTFRLSEFSNQSIKLLLNPTNNFKPIHPHAIFIFNWLLKLGYFNKVIIFIGVVANAAGYQNKCHTAINMPLPIHLGLLA